MQAQVPLYYVMLELQGDILKLVLPKELIVWEIGNILLDFELVFPP